MKESSKIEMNYPDLLFVKSPLIPLFEKGELNKVTLYKLQGMKIREVDS